MNMVFDLLIYLGLIGIGAALMGWVCAEREKAVKAERANTERWRKAYEELRYQTKPAMDEAPEPVQLGAQDVWVMRRDGQIVRGARTSQ